MIYQVRYQHGSDVNDLRTNYVLEENIKYIKRLERRHSLHMKDDAPISDIHQVIEIKAVEMKSLISAIMYPN